MSFNIRYGTAADGPDAWGSRKSGVVRMLGERKPAILALQEALWFQIEDILAAMPGYRCLGVGRDDGLKEGEFAAILFDTTFLSETDTGVFWLSDHPETPGSNDWGDTNVRICTWAHFAHGESGRKFRVFNTHLAHASQSAREKGVQLIVERMSVDSHDLPTILCGDFNADENNLCHRPLREKSFRDSYRDANPVGPAPTYNAFQADYPDEKLDYIWVDPSIKVCDAEIVHDQVDGRWLSDHFPIAATIDDESYTSQ